MKRTKGWSGSAIRKLARARLEAKVSGGPVPPLDRSNSVALTSSGPQKPSLDGSSPEFVWGRFEKSFGQQVLVVVPESVFDRGEEMGRLCHTLGLEVLRTFSVKRPHRIHPATFLGAGRIEEIRHQIQSLGVSAVVFELPLSPVQVRNLEDALQVPVLDRQAVILSIFKHHAQTRLAKIQVELAQLKYLQSRLSGLWMGLSRQRGGRGGLRSRGQGETRLELDRRVIKERIAILKRKLEDAERTVDVQSARRSHLPRAALVGYTNAGKTSLMRRLTKADLREEDKLFSTLDTTVRVMVPPTDPKVLISDTVGFVRDLPHDLVLSFRSTLQESANSRVLLHVLDMSHPDWMEQWESAEAVLTDIGANAASRIFVLNKMDLLGENLILRKSAITRHIRKAFPQAPIVMVSARTGEGVEGLKKMLREQCAAKEPLWSLAL